MCSQDCRLWHWKGNYCCGYVAGGNHSGVMMCSEKLPKLYQGMTLVTNINLSLKMSSWVGEITEQELGWVELE